MTDTQSTATVRDKQFETIRARCALAGYALMVIGQNGLSVYVVSRWGMSKDFTDLAEVEKFLHEVGAAQS